MTKLTVWAIRKEYELFKEMHAEGRTRDLRVTSYREWDDDREIELVITEVQETEYE